MNGMALSVDLRTRVVQAYQNKEGGYQQIADRFGIAICSVRRWVALKRENGAVNKRPHKGRQAKISAEQLPQLEALVEAKPDRTALELSHQWSNMHNIEIHRSSMVRALQRLKMTVKKRPSEPQNETKSQLS